MKRIYSCSLSTLGAIALVLAGCSQSANSDDKPAAAPAPAVANASLDVGAVAPDFALPDQNNKVHRLADYQGKTVVLAFYPADMTSGCTIEARNLTQALPEFEKRGVQLFGVSVQDVNSKKAFCDKEGIKYSLLADVEKKMSKDYGVLLPQGVSKRVSFVIAPNGRIAGIDRNVRPASVAKDTLALVDQAQAEAKTLAEGGAGSPASKADAAKIEIDKPVAAFTLPNYDGKATEVGGWDKSKATVIMFIATKCPISNAYNARMANLAKTYGAKGVRFIGINPNKAELADEVAAHAKEHNFSFPVLKDTGNKIADRFEAKVTPEVYVVDSAGVLRYHGRIDNDKNEAAVHTRDLQVTLDAMLDGKPVAVKKTPAFGCSIKRL